MGDYDSDVRNDVCLQVFRNGILHDSLSIPYQLVRGGKAYRYRRPSGGKITFIATAIPEGHPGILPGTEGESGYYEQQIKIKASARAKGYVPREGNLYIGTTVIDENTTDRKTYRVAMSPCFSKVTVIVMDTGVFSVPPVVGVEGTASMMRGHDRRTEGDIEVCSEVLEQDGTYTTGVMYLLPAAESRSMRVNLYCNGRLAMWLDSQEVSVAGREIIIRIYPLRFIAEITVDGWTYKTQLTTL